MRISNFKFIFLLLLFLNFCSTICAENLQIEADNTTFNDYKQEILDEKPNTLKSGRVWTDKSVIAQSDQPINIDNHSISFDDNFLEIFSALGSNSEIGETKNSPIDLVLTMDCSESMGFEVDNAVYDETLGRKPLVIDKSAQAINQIIDYLMSKNPNNHIALVVYQKNAKTIFPLGRLEHQDQKPFLEVIPNLEEPIEEEGSKGYRYNLSFSALQGEQEINETVSTELDNLDILGNGTNFHAGFYQGLKILADNDQAQTSGNRAKLINLTDGIPNCFYDDPWQEPQETKFSISQKDTDSSKEALILQTVLSTAYLKAAVTKNYDYPVQFVLLHIATDLNYAQDDPVLLNGIINKV